MLSLLICNLIRATESNVSNFGMELKLGGAKASHLEYLWRVGDGALRSLNHILDEGE